MNSKAQLDNALRDHLMADLLSEAIQRKPIELDFTFKKVISITQCIEVVAVNVRKLQDSSSPFRFIVRYASAMLS